METLKLTKQEAKKPVRREDIHPAHFTKEQRMDKTVEALKEAFCIDLDEEELEMEFKVLLEKERSK